MNRTHQRYADLDRIRFVAAHYNDLLGLRALPLAILLILLPLVTGSLVTGRAHAMVMWSSPLVLVAAGVLGLWVHRYYRDRFGAVAALRSSAFGGWAMVLGGLALLGAALFVQWAGWEEALAFSPAWAIVWTAILGVALTRLRFIPYYAAIAGAGLLLALLPFGWLPGIEGHPYSTDKWGLFVMGVLLLALAYMDHRYLSNVLGPVPEDSNGEASEAGRASA